MKAIRWQEKIVEYCRLAGTYQPSSEEVINTLAQILEQRDKAYKKYIDDGGSPIIEYTNKAKQTNIVKNPVLLVWDDLNKSALAYWRDLGLTPLALKKVDAEATKTKKTSKLAEALKDLG